MFAKDIVVGKIYEVRVNLAIPDVRVDNIWVGKDVAGKKLTRYCCCDIRSGEPMVIKSSRAFRQESTHE